MLGYFLYLIVRFCRAKGSCFEKSLFNCVIKMFTFKEGLSQVIKNKAVNIKDATPNLL